MKVVHITTGVETNVPVGKSKRLVASGSWRFAHSTAEEVKEQLEITDESSAEAAERQLGIQDTPEQVERPTEAPETQEQAAKPAASIEEMRVWAQQNGVPDIKDKGKLPRRAVDAYLEAHKD